MSIRNLPQEPTGATLLMWAKEMHAYMSAVANNTSGMEPRAILLEHQVPNRMARAAVDGIVMFDPALGKIVFSKAGVWEPLS